MSARLSVLLLLGAWSMAGAQSAPPIRFITEVRPEVARTLQLLEAQQGLCKLANEAEGKPVGPLGLPSAAQVAAHVSLRHEHLLDGTWEAVYQTISVLTPDFDQGCKIRVRREYRADVAQVCGGGWGGRASASVTGSAQEPDSAPELEEREDESAFYKTLPKTGLPKSVSPHCITVSKKKNEDTTALARSSTKSGQSCIWWDELTHLRLHGKPLPEEAATGLRICVHPTLHYYPVRKLLSSHRLLVLKHETVLPKGAEPNPLTPQVDGPMDTVLWQQGAPIDPARFAKAAVQAHIDQPLWVDLGSSKP